MRYDERMTNKFESQSGQIALIILLIMGVTMVIAVSLAQRTTEDVSLTTKQAETTKVFSAAQSGAEQKLTEVLTALRAGTTVNTAPQTLPNINDSSVNLTVDELSSFIQPLDEGETYQVELPSPGSTVSIEWGDAASNCVDEASLLVARYNTSAGVTTAYYSGYYPIGSGSCAGAGPDGFGAPTSGGSNGRRNLYQYTVASGDEFLRVIPIYNSTDLYVSGGDNPQYAVTANAENALGENQESRVIQVTTSDLQPPSFLDYAVYSGTTIIK